jgi:hypothetical protein
MSTERFVSTNIKGDTPSEIVTGDAYLQLYKEFITDPSYQFRWPHNCFKFARFILKCRRKASAWRNLSFIKNQSHVHNYKNSDGKNEDYLLMVYELLRDVRNVNQQGGLDWTMNHNSVTKRVKLSMPIMFIIGDTEGHDKLCCK